MSLRMAAEEVEELPLRHHGDERGLALHPAEIADHQLDADFLAERKQFGIRNVGILPGSRHLEVTRNGPILLKTVAHLLERHRDVRFRVACYKEQHRELLRGIMDDLHLRLPEDRVEFCVGRTPEIIELADCCLMVSGSVSLDRCGVVA